MQVRADRLVAVCRCRDRTQIESAYIIRETTMSNHKPDLEGDALSETRDEVTDPPMYRVLLLNDDYTTMEFVIDVLKTVFHKSDVEATRIMLNVHQAGVGICGVYTYEIAETKVDTVHSLARENGFPLKCSMERE